MRSFPVRLPCASHATSSATAWRRRGAGAGRGGGTPAAGQVVDSAAVSVGLTRDDGYLTGASIGSLGPRGGKIGTKSHRSRVFSGKQGPYYFRSHPAERRQ